MEIVLLKTLFIVSVSAQVGKHVFVPHGHNWIDAQRHCRTHNTDLSPIPTRRDEGTLKKASNGIIDGEFWIGLYRNGSEWKWSGGGSAVNIPWAENEPNSNVKESVASVCWHNCTRWTGWHNTESSFQLPFLCFNLIMIEYKRTWEEAVEHCRRTHTALTSLTSKTEHLLALSTMKGVGITERVWIGLRYLGDRWLWVDGNPLKYKAWHKGGQDFQCPTWRRCGALTKGGPWESWDCLDKLSFICY